MTTQRPSPTDLASVEVMFRAERDVQAWQERHDRGEVPGRWPYGLDRLALTGARVTARSLASPSRAARVRDRLAQTTSLLRRPAEADLGGRRTIGVAWDENIAQRMLASARRPEMYSGAIWLTDALQRGRDDGLVRTALRTLRQMSGVFVISSAQVAPLVQALGTGGPPVSFFRFGVDSEFFPVQPYPDRPLVASVGGDRDRDPATLFAALERVHRERPDVDIVVQSTSDLPAPPGVTKVPHLSHLELRQLYGRASVVAIATRPNLHLSGMTVGLETLATGRPLALTRTPGAEDYFTDGTTALLSPTGDHEALAGSILSLLGSPEDARRMGERGRRSVETELTADHAVARLGAVLGLTSAS